MDKLLMKLGFLLFGLAAVGYLIILIDASLQDDTAAGLIGLLVLGGMALCLLQALKDRLGNKEDDYYAKNLHVYGRV